MTDGMMVEAIRSVSMTGTRDSQAVGAAAPVANPDAVAKFQAAMGVEETKQVDAIPFADEMSAVWRSAQDKHQEMLHRTRALTEIQEQGKVSVAALTQLQYEIANLSFQQEVVAKVADKASNAIQTLIKNQ